VKLLLENNANVNFTSSSGKTELWRASELNNTEIVTILLEAKADINIKDKKGRSPLNIASKNGNKEVVQILLNNGATWDELCKSTMDEKVPNIITDPITLSTIQPGENVYINKNEIRGRYCYSENTANENKIKQDPFDRDLLFSPSNVTPIVTKLIDFMNPLK